MTPEAELRGIRAGTVVAVAGGALALTGGLIMYFHNDPPVWPFLLGLFLLSAGLIVAGMLSGRRRHREAELPPPPFWARTGWARWRWLAINITVAWLVAGVSCVLTGLLGALIDELF